MVVLVIVVISLLIAGALIYTGNLQPLIHKIINHVSHSHVISNNTNSANKPKNNSHSTVPSVTEKADKLPHTNPNHNLKYNKSSDAAVFSDWENEILHAGKSSKSHRYVGLSLKVVFQ